MSDGWRSALLGALLLLGCGPAPRAGARVHAVRAARSAPFADPCARWPPIRGCLEGLASGPYLTCALSDERAFCWGLHHVPGGLWARTRASLAQQTELTRAAHGTFPCTAGGQCDLGALGAWQLRPDDAAFPRRFVLAAKSVHHACAVGDDGSVWCQGQNAWGELGNGTTREVDQPTRVTGLPPARDLGLGTEHSCALTRADEVWCWGRATGFPPGTSLPSPRLQSWAIATTGSGGELTCVLLEDGRVACRRRCCQSYDLLEGASDVVELATGVTGGLCARRRDGQVSCWSETGASVEAELSGAIALVPGRSCALLDTGRTRCLGSHDHTGRSLPAHDLVGLGPVRAVGSVPGIMMSPAACAPTEAGLLRCWGGVGADWSFRPGRAAWDSQWETSEVVKEQPVALEGAPGDVVELSPRGACARAADGSVHLIARVALADPKVVRLAAVTASGASAARLLPSDSCVGQRADGSVFVLAEPMHAFDGHPWLSPPPVVTELPEAHGALQLELGRYVTCARFEADTRCFAPGADDQVVADERAHDLFIESTDRGERACALLDAGGLRCRAFDREGPGEVEAPFADLSSVPLRGFALPERR